MTSVTLLAKRTFDTGREVLAYRENMDNLEKGYAVLGTVLMVAAVGLAIAALCNPATCPIIGLTIAAFCLTRGWNKFMQTRNG